MIALRFYFKENNHLLKHIFNTASLKIVAMVMNFIVMYLTAHFLLAEGRGEVAVFMANMAFIILVNGFVGSSVIIYLTPKTNFFNLLIPSYVWAGISSVLTPIFFSLFMSFFLQWLSVKTGIKVETELWGIEFIKSSHYLLLVVCAFMGSVFEYNYMVLIGKEKITQAQLLNVSRSLLLVLALSAIFYGLGTTSDVYSYFVSLFFSYSVGLILSFISIARLKEKFDLSAFKDVVGRLISMGFIDQLSNILQFINKRLPLYYLMYIINDKGDTGVLSIAIALTEATLFLPQAVSVVQYSKISNSKDSAYNISISKKMFRFNLAILFVGLGALSLIPNQFFIWLFGESFAEVGQLIPLLAIGLVFFGATSIFNHYFSGIGKFQENVYSNLLGLAATIGIGCFWLIPNYGLIGATLTPSISYIVLSTYLILSFKRKTGSSLKDLFPQKADFFEFKSLVSNRLKKGSS